MQESYSFYSLTYYQTKGAENCYRQPYSYTFFRTKNPQLAHQVFIFHLIGKSPHQKMTPFEFQKCKQGIEKGRVKKISACRCEKCEDILEIRHQQFVLEENYDFSQRQEPFIGAQDNAFSNQAEVDFYTKECIDFETKYAEDQLGGKIEKMEIE